ncbi:MAG: cyclic nucleotide-binding domain-containing protein, partial [Defluviitaleaceae bacterium]|nr:cyclic nucleotide-binding domain-containing protein [Defluviitaleaceae bacterium]
MPLIEFKEGSVICSEGEPLRNLLFVTKGSAEASIGGHPFRFEQGDAIGLYDLNVGNHSYTYTAMSDVTVFSHPYEDFATLEKLLKDNANVSSLLVGSLCRQIAEFLQRRSALKQESDGTYELVNDVYPAYERLCGMYAFTAKKIAGLEDIQRISETDQTEDWMHGYYVGIKELEPTVQKVFFREAGIAAGFLRRGTEDMAQVIESCGMYQEHLNKSADVFLSRDGHDLLSIVSELHVGSAGIRGADAAVGRLISQLTELMSEMTCIDPELYTNRLGTYKKTLDTKRATTEANNAPDVSGLKQNLSDSMSLILEYSGCPEEMCETFERCVREYTKLTDRGSSDDVAYRLRKELTEMFYVIYQQSFIKSLDDPALPTIIKMFLNFGYVDAALAGYENADYLYSIADSLKGDPDMGVYTLCEWFTAIYNGKKEPSRNDFDMDYAGYIRELKASGKLDAKAEARMLTDLEGKLRFEMENVFPIVNKITFGRITTFCPLFADHNVQRKLEVARVTPDTIKETLDEILTIDFSAFSRETMYTNPDAGVQRESVNVHVMPDIILMPNIGVRGTMWQEIEGAKRTTAARMFMPILLLIDLKPLIIRLTAEFRWEMCKRIQGSRWSDLSDPSLTSEYFHYLQFYR